MSGRSDSNGKEISKLKKEKYELKQRKKVEQLRKQSLEREFIEKHSSFVTWLEIDDVNRVRQWMMKKNENHGQSDTEKNFGELECEEDTSINVIRKSKKRKHHEERNNTTFGIECSYDQKIYDMICPFLDLKENNNSIDEYIDASGRRIFIAEGTETVRLCIQRCKGSKFIENTGGKSCEHNIISILTKPATFFNEPVNLLQTIKESFPHYFKDSDGCKNPTKNDDKIPPPFHVFIGTENVLTEIAGFPISRGALGCGFIPQNDENWLYSYLEKKIDDNSCHNLGLLALDQISDTANLGSLIRSSAAFGIDCVILSHDCCDAWYRRAVRVSMGHVLSIPSVRVRDLASTISTMKERFGMISYAAVVDNSAEKVLEDIPKGQIGHWCCVLGNEGIGISEQVIASCDCRIRIGMTDSVDSLSVGVAGGILLHGIREREKK